MKKIVVIDFGGQFAHLIATKIRSLGAYSEIWSNEKPASEFNKDEIAGIIFSGGPSSVYEKDAPTVDPEILNLQIPIFAICYGHQLISQLLGGEVKAANVREFGKAIFEVQVAKGIFKDFPKKSIMWMSHGDEVVSLPSNFEKVGITEDGEMAAAANFEKNIFTVQFHPEVTHSEKGLELLDNFVNFCGVKNTWKLDNFIEQACENIQKQVGKKNVFLMVSGGVDSSVCFALLEKALGKERVFGLLVDTGLMRKNEARKVKSMLGKAGFNDLHIAYEEEKFLNNLKNITEPEKKREIIGDAFLDVQEEVSEKLKLNPDDWFLAQGTIFPDTIETGGSKNAAKIKTHHNRVARVEKLIEQGKVVEPIKELFKDEVRIVGKQLGLPDEMIERRPFPGPGLGVRILCTNEENSLNDAKIIEQNIYSSYGIKNKILPIRSVGVQGDARTFAHPLAIFSDKWNFEKFEKIATEIPNKYREINRVIICLSDNNPNLNNLNTKKKSFTSKDRVKMLQEADDIIDNIVNQDLNEKDQKRIWQFPVVLAPIGFNDQESIILRPIESENAMTAKATDLPYEILKKMSDKITSEIEGISAVFFDLTSKPPGTIEWE